MSLPTIAELQQLPTRGLVALTARCARRLAPLILRYWPRARREQIEVVEQAVLLTDSYAGGAGVMLEAARAASAAVDRVQQDLLHRSECVYAAMRAASTTNRVYSFIEENDALQAAERALHVAWCAPILVLAILEGRSSPAEFANHVLYVWSRALEAESTIGQAVAGNTPLGRTLRRDFERLCEVAARGPWTAETPVPPSAFGPLWPEGAPAGWLTGGPGDRILGPVAETLLTLRRRNEQIQEARLPLVRAVQADLLALEGKNYGYEENREIAHTINETLDRLWVALRCPDRGCIAPAQLSCSEPRETTPSLIKFTHFQYGRHEGDVAVWRRVYHGGAPDFPRLQLVWGDGSLIPLKEEDDDTAEDISGLLEGGLREIENALQAPRLSFEALLRSVEGRNYESLEANQRIASLIQETADRLRLAFVCTRCGEPARFRCSQAATAKTGMFTFSHGRQTHTGTTTIPRLQTTQAAKDGRKTEAPST